MCAQVRVPLLLPGENVITEVEPAKSLYAKLEEIDRIPGILSSSLMVGFAWADTPHTGASVIVSAESDYKLALKEANKLADAFWNARFDLKFQSETCSVSEAVSRACSSNIKPVFISDSGDNITAGGDGDSLEVLHELLKQKVTNFVFSQICSKELTEESIRVGIAGEVTLPFLKNYDAKVIWCVESIVQKPEVVFAVVSNSGSKILLSDRRYPLVKLDWLIEGGIDLSKVEITVFKLGYLMPELHDTCPRHIMALSTGPTSLDVESFHYTKIKRPMFPLDKDFDWRA